METAYAATAKAGAAHPHARLSGSLPKRFMRSQTRETMPKLKIEDLTKRNVWALTEAELNAMLIDAKKRDSFAENEKHYMNILRPVFDVVYIDRADKERVSELEQEHYDIFSIPNEGNNNAIAIRKIRIKKITDLTLENVPHMQAADILKLIDQNLGTGWQGLPLAIQDIIQSVFYVDCSVMPTYTLHRKGGIIAKRKADGYEILEIDRGGWTEAICIKPKPATAIATSPRQATQERDEDEAGSKLSKLLKSLDTNDDGPTTDSADIDEDSLNEEGLDVEDLTDDDTLGEDDAQESEPEFVNIDDVGDDFEEEED